MTLEQHTEIIRRIRENMGDSAVSIVDDLAELSSDYMSTTEVLQTAQREVAALKTDKELLQNANNKLFLQVGVTAPKENDLPPQDETPEKREFATLFKEEK